MGGIDIRYLCSKIRPTEYTIRSITSISSPHRGSSIADYVVDTLIGEDRLPTFLSLISAIPGGGKAFSELRRANMAAFNEATPNVEGVSYFSYGARSWPGVFDKFRLPWSILKEREGDNDGLVSVESSKWGEVSPLLHLISAQL
jgi:triacylglycerol lipase